MVVSSASMNRHSVDEQDVARGSLPFCSVCCSMPPCSFYGVLCRAPLLLHVVLLLLAALWPLVPSRVVCCSLPLCSMRCSLLLSVRSIVFCRAPLLLFCCAGCLLAPGLYASARCLRCCRCLHCCLERPAHVPRSAAPNLFYQVFRLRCDHQQ